MFIELTKEELKQMKSIDNLMETTENEADGIIVGQITRRRY